MKRTIIVGLALILSALTGVADGTADSPQDRLLNLFPASVLDAFALQPGECPPAYARITNSNLLARAGITENPAYLTRRSDLEDVIQMDGAASFIALYGQGESVRLMVKGVFFLELQHALKYALVQSTRHRLVMAYRRDTPGGIWLLFIACDPDLTYDKQELLAIARGQVQYRRRLALSPLFDQMHAGLSD